MLHLLFEKVGSLAKSLDEDREIEVSSLGSKKRTTSVMC
jgi:hypothetical protein